MRIKGIQKTTLLDFPDRLASTAFTPGCNFKCGFCYNSGIVNDDEELGEVPVQEYLDFLALRKKVLEGVVVSGGEPTLQKDLPEFLEKVKAIGYLVKLDTNGTNPEMLEELIEKRLVDYVAMDIKGPLENYERICGVLAPLDKIRKSIELLKNSKIEYEFRTTLLPEFHKEEDFEKIAELLEGAKIYYLQQFVPVDTLIDSSLRNARKFSLADFEKFKKVLEKKVKKVEFRNLD
ncbi:MAG: anaerobic ribonucleoside-triphosphate reductase activating protein [Candidatus Diapherotrites archaeon]|nr:anaerobic ribonucleoside-triphosphate reductase activating protein [Candidatus Diapherotrites archaeon]